MRHDRVWHDPASAPEARQQAADRRAEERHIAVRWVGKMFAGTACDLCVVRSISSVGGVVQVLSPPPVGAHVRIDLDSQQQFLGEVISAGEASVEIRFHVPIDLSAVVRVQSRNDPDPPVGQPRQDMSCSGVLHVGDERHQVEVRDLSQGGARIRTTAGLLAADQHFTLAIPGLEPLDGQVRWRDGEGVGLLFAEAIPFDQLTYWCLNHDREAEADALARRWPRHSIFFKTWLRLSDRPTPLDIHVHNLSRGGLLASAAQSLRGGEAIVVGLGRIGEVAGHVAWTREDRAGIVFERIMDAKQILDPIVGLNLRPLLHQHQASGRRPGLKSR